MNDNVSISVSGNTVAVMWDSNSTGISNPVLRTSSDGGNTFSNIVTLNSTPGGINKPAGANMTTGATGNITGGAHGSAMSTTNPAGLPKPLGPPPFCINGGNGVGGDCKTR
jgi:hypothetical protein